MADETIVTQFLVDAEGAIADSKKLREQIESTKTQLRLMAAEGRQSFSDMAAGMVKAYETMRREQQKSETGKLALNLDLDGMKAAIASANKDIREYKNLVVSALKEIKSEEKSAEAVVKQSEEQMQASRRKAAQAASAEVKQQVSALKELEGQQKNVSGSTTTLASRMKSLATSINQAVLGLSAFAILRSIANWMKEAADGALTLVKATYSLEVGVRALQRAGVDISLQGAYEQIEKLKAKYGGLATDAEWRAGTAAFYNLNRDLGFTAEQFNILQDKITGLAIINNRSMDEVQKTVALALSSGYTEGLQRLGVSINRVTIAMEANRLGFEGGYMALTEKERALATYNLILAKTAVYEEDLAKYQETVPGRIEAANKKWEDAKNLIGTALLPIWLKFVDGLAAGLDMFVWGADALGKFNKKMEETYGLLWEITTFPFNIFLEGMETFSSGLGLAREEILGDTDVNMMSAEDAMIENIADKLNEKLDTITALEEEIADRRREIELDLVRDMAEIDENSLEKLQDILKDHYRKMDDIAQKGAEKLADAQEQYALDVQQTWDDYYYSLDEAQQEYHDKELEAEEDFQEKMLRLREDLLFNLEDALRARDARQVLRLIRSYKLDKERLEREKADQQRDNARDYARQLGELERQREQRLRKLKQELDLRLRMIRIQTQRELAEERERYEQAIQDQLLAMERQKADRQQKYDEQMADLEDYEQRKLEKIAEGLFEELRITGEGLAKIREALNSTLGPGGYAEEIYRYYAQMSQAYMAEAAAFGFLSGDMSGLRSGPGGKPHKNKDDLNKLPGNDDPKGGGVIRKTEGYLRASGGGGAPMSTMPAIEGYLRASGGGGAPARHSTAPASGEFVTVGVELSPNLVGKIVDQSLNIVADVFNDVVRKQ